MAIVEQELWDAVQAQLAAKAPPRKRPKNDPQQAMLRGLLTDPQGRPMVPTYGSSGPRRYAYYETRKDLARPGHPPAMRFQRGRLDQHLIGHLNDLLKDEHALRKLSGIDEAGQLRMLFARAHLLQCKLDQIAEVEQAVRAFIRSIIVRSIGMEVMLDPRALGVETDATWSWAVPLAFRKPFREARLRIDGETSSGGASADLLELLSEAAEARRLILASPNLSLNQLGKVHGRCRTHLARLLRISWLSPRIVEAIADGSQPKSLTRKMLLTSDMPLEWEAQEHRFALAS